ncbi:MAG: helix-turn-helix domain-containing protein [Roseateles asaccharophilus]|uniref:helix-turn-helix domain-containing protein n=1 Tax=Roseateles asaccharophilus TaxID=582607 RepID=UPI00391CA66D
MLNRLPSDTGSFEDLLADLGLGPSDTARIARALGVSESTVWRWKRSGAPKTARLALWWLSREGHSMWDAEMANRTQLAAATNAALWRRVAGLDGARRQPSPARSSSAANDWAFSTAEATP